MCALPGSTDRPVVRSNLCFAEAVSLNLSSRWVSFRLLLRAELITRGCTWSACRTFASLWCLFVTVELLTGDDIEVPCSGNNRSISPTMRCAAWGARELQVSDVIVCAKANFASDTGNGAAQESGMQTRTGWSHHSQSRRPLVCRQSYRLRKRNSDSVASA